MYVIDIEDYADMTLDVLNDPAKQDSAGKFRFFFSVPFCNNN